MVRVVHACIMIIKDMDILDGSWSFFIHNKPRKHRDLLGYGPSTLPLRQVQLEGGDLWIPVHGSDRVTVMNKRLMLMHLYDTVEPVLNKRLITR